MSCDNVLLTCSGTGVHIIAPDIVTWSLKQDKSYFDITVAASTDIGGIEIDKVYDKKPGGITVSRVVLSPVASQFRVFFPPPEIKFQGKYSITAKYGY